MGRIIRKLAGCLVLGILCGCSSPQMTNTARMAMEQMLLCEVIEQGVGQVDFSRYAGKKVLLEYDYLSPQVDKPYMQAFIELHLAKSGVTVTRKAEEADFLIQPSVGVFATDYSKFLIGTPTLPIPLPYTDLTFAIPEIPIFQRFNRVGFGRFCFNILHADRSPAETVIGINASSQFTNWVVMLIPFTSHSLPLMEFKTPETQYEFSYE